jgi:hypothetical protein
MAIKRKTSHKKLYIAIFLIVVLSVAVAALVYASIPTVKATPGVKIGDYFVYSITGSSDLQSLDATVSPGFDQYNQTDYFKVTVTGVSGSNVSIDTLWAFKNGTQESGQQTIDLSSGNESVTNGFWAIYPSNLNVGSLLRPTGTDGLKVNMTDTKAYASSSRQRNFWFIENEFYDVNDPTHNTLRDDYTGVYFDKQTGMLETLNNISAFNNPLKTESITWKLVSTNVWAVQ